MEIVHSVMDVFITAAIFFSVKYLWNHHRKKNIFIIEDNPLEHVILRSSLSVVNSRLIICRDYDEFIIHRLLRKPDAVVIDYRLPRLTGDKIFKLCRSQAIPSVLITADSQPIFGIDENNIIRKTGDYVEKIKTFIQQAINDNALNTRL